jgi:hypothetical protein
MFHNIPTEQPFVEAAEIFEFLNSLRPELLNQLLDICKSIKVKRIFLYLAENQNHPWWNEINKKISIGSGKRVVEKNGVLNKKYLITVPSELFDKSEANDEGRF